MFKTDRLLFTTSKKWVFFSVFLGLLIIDRLITLIYFGFVYTDIDQMVMWNGASDYAQGIFHEPFFYGQPFNYMLEAFLAAPLLWINIPVHIALPVVTTFISLLPFVVLALFFMKKEQPFWACLCLAFPVLLPIEYNFLTTLSRGFVQAHFFIPLLFIPLFSPQSKKSVTILFLASAICFIANQSSLIIIAPIALYVYTYHVKSLSFYLKSLLVIPFFIADYFAKHFYVIHPERVLHELVGMELDSQTFLTSFKNAHLFENLFPFFSDLGILYPFLFLLLSVVSLTKSRKKEFLFILSILFVLLVTFAIPKVQELIPNTGIFFTSSRLYLYLPVLLIISTYLIFQKQILKTIPIFILLLLCVTGLITKNISIQNTIQKTVSQTIFPVAKTQDIITRVNDLKSIVEKHNIDLIIHSTSGGWKYVFDSYAFNPITRDYNGKNEKTISVNVDGDRRSWLYPNSTNCRQILLNGFSLADSVLKPFDYKIINQSQIVIKNNKLNVKDLLTKLNLQYGNTPL